MKNVIITGVSDGLGLALAKQFIKNNINVLGISRSKPNINIQYIKVDLGNETSVKEAIQTIKKDFSNFDVLINCASLFNIQTIKRIESDEISMLYKVNIIGHIQLTLGLIEEIKKNNTDIVNIGSTSAYKGVENQLVYSTTKWAIRGFNENLKIELKDTKSRIIGFNPGGFKSNMYEKATGKKLLYPSNWMDIDSLSNLIIMLLELPKNMEVSEIIINRN